MLIPELPEQTVVQFPPAEHQLEQLLQRQAGKTTSSS